MQRTVLLLIAFASLPCGATAADQIDEYVTAEMRREHIPGLALGIYRRDEIVKAQGYGLANVELKRASEARDGLPIRPVGKFTASATMLLAEEGKIALHEVAPAFPTQRLGQIIAQ